MHQSQNDRVMGQEVWERVQDRFKMAAVRGLENVNPEVHQKIKERALLAEEEDDNVVDKIDQREVFGILLYAQTLLLERKLGETFVACHINYQCSSPTKHEHILHP